GKTAAHQKADLRRACRSARRDPRTRCPVEARSAVAADSRRTPPRRPAFIDDVPAKRRFPRWHDLLHLLTPRFGRVDAPIVVMGGDVVWPTRVENGSDIPVLHGIDRVLRERKARFEGGYVHFFRPHHRFMVSAMGVIVAVPSRKGPREATNVGPCVTRLRPPTRPQIPFSNYGENAKPIKNMAASGLSIKRQRNDFIIISRHIHFAMSPPTSVLECVTMESRRCYAREKPLCCA